MSTNTSSSKRGREEMYKEEDDDDKAKYRGNYRCSKCNLPKKGHVCPYQQRIRKKDPNNFDGQTCLSVEVQADLDHDNNLKSLDLSRQGLLERGIRKELSSNIKEF